MPLPKVKRSASKKHKQQTMAACMRMLAKEHPEWSHDRRIAA